MHTQLDYKTEKQVSFIVRLFWTKFFTAAVLVAITVGACCKQALYISDHGGSESLFPTYFMAGAFTLVFGGLVLGLIFEKFFNLTTRIIKGEECIKLSMWMTNYVPVEDYVKEVSSRRAVVLYDYFVVHKWVQEMQCAASVENQQRACKKIQGLA